MSNCENTQVLNKKWVGSFNNDVSTITKIPMYDQIPITAVLVVNKPLAEGNAPTGIAHCENAALGLQSHLYNFTFGIAASAIHIDQAFGNAIGVDTNSVLYID